MMTSEQGRSMPERGEIVVCTVREITSQGIYVTLDQYGGMNGFLHVSEISTGWVRNIERVAKPQQKLVLKVIRADRTRKEIDLSLRQVTNEERRAKVIEWKRAERAQAIMNAVRKKVSLEETQLAAASSPGSSDIKITYAGAPRYRIRITADDYKQAEKIMTSVLDKIKDGLGKHGAFNFKREISRKYGGAS